MNWDRVLSAGIYVLTAPIWAPIWFALVVVDRHLRKAAQ